MKVLKILLCLGVVALGASAAWAGDFHQGTTLNCADCHNMHYSDDGATAPSVGTSGPYNHLLRESGNDLCLVCHDGQTSAPDVFESDTNSVSGGRSAGALNDTSGSGDWVSGDGHTLGATTTAPGTAGSFSPTGGLQCVNCHAQHGNSNYRNLLTDPCNDTGTAVVIGYVTGSFDAGEDVTQANAVTTPADYSASNISYGEPVSTDSAMGNFCSDCHKNFHGDPGDSNIGNLATGFLRHPTAGIDIGNSVADGTHSSKTGMPTYKVKVMTDSGGDYTAFCLSCHKAHGNKNPFGLIYAKGDAALGEEGDGSSVKDLCQHCHVQ